MEDQHHRRSHKRRGRTGANSHWPACLQGSFVAKERSWSDLLPGWTGAIDASMIGLNGNRGGDFRVRLIADQAQVFVAEIQQPF